MAMVAFTGKKLFSDLLFYKLWPLLFTFTLSLFGVLDTQIGQLSAVGEDKIQDPSALPRDCTYKHTQGKVLR